MFRTFKKRIAVTACLVFGNTQDKSTFFFVFLLLAVKKLKVQFPFDFVKLQQKALRNKNATMLWSLSSTNFMNSG
jgi:hypothetical protein